MAKGNAGGKPEKGKKARTQGNTGSSPVAGKYPIDTGDCELVEDRFNPNGWVLMINGVPSSHIDLNNPQQLDFEYMHWIANLIESRFDSEVGIRALHLGGGACTLARYVASAFPQSRQVVVEIDSKLASLVREWFDLPRAPLLRIRVGEAREVTTSLTANSRDLIIRDVFAGSRTPVALTTVEFTQQVHRVLSPGGMYLANCGDTPDRELLKTEAATIASLFTYVAFVADATMLKGRRYGNVIIAGSDKPLGSPQLTRKLLTIGLPAQFWDDTRVRTFAASAQPNLD